MTVKLLNKRFEKILEAALSNFLRHLLGISKLDREGNQSVRKEVGVQNTVLKIQQYY
jgi:hypothetical protein